MLGCKYLIKKTYASTLHRINRYMLGCKYKDLIYTIEYHAELIDTCWDVNQELTELEAWSLVELIDTCWDVNFL